MSAGDPTRHKRNYLKKREENLHRSRKKNLEKYGLTIMGYDILSEKQGHVCAICGNAETAMRGDTLKRLAVDHCHQSGHVRGLLCADCNRGLGMFKDNISALRKAAEYLEGNL